MSLQVWLPLKGDLINQGLHESTWINGSQAIVDNDSNLGTCYTFENLSGSRLYYNGNVADFMNTYINKHSHSLSAWVKTTQHTTCVFCLTYEEMFGIRSDKLQFALSRSGSTVQLTGNTTVTDGKWHHIVATYDTSDNMMRVYVDGVLDAEKQYNSDLTYLYASSWTNSILLSGNSNNSTAIAWYYYLGKLSDIRIYDHALSTYEVHELSNALIMNYKLTDNSFLTGNPCLNMYNLPTFNTSTSTGGWSHWGRANAKGTYSQNTNVKYIYRPDYCTYSHMFGNTATGAKDGTNEYLLYQQIPTENRIKSIQCIIKETNSAVITEDICFPAWNGHAGGVPSGRWTSIDYLGNGFYLCKCEGFIQSANPQGDVYSLVGIYVSPGYSLYVSEFYMEYGEHCSDILATTPNMITSLTKGGQTTITNNEALVTSGTAADTYFTINLTENIVVGQRYTISCFVSGLGEGGKWVFPLGGQNNTTLAWELYNGYNQKTFVANGWEWGSKRIFMDDNGATDRTKVMTISKLSVVKHYSYDNTKVFDCSGYCNDAEIRSSNFRNWISTGGTLNAYNSGSVTWDATNKVYNITSAVTSSAYGSGISIPRVLTVPYGATYRVSFQVYVPTAHSFQIDINNVVESGTAWNGNDNDNSSARTAVKFTVEANTWTTITFGSINNRDLNVNKIGIIPYDGIGLVTSGDTGPVTWQMRNLKLSLTDTATNENIGISTDSPRYDSCFKFTNSAYIKIPDYNYSALSNSFTFAWWSNISNMDGLMAWGFNDGNRLNLFPTGGVFCMNTGDGGTNKFKDDGGNNVSHTAYNNGWHFYCVTGDGTTNKLYVDGEYKGKSTTYKAITGTRLQLSGWDMSGSYKWNNGSLSDFRLYARPLSDNDIRALYRTAAKIDNKNNVYTYELRE